MQGLQSKLCDCVVVKDSLQSLSDELILVSDTATASQLAADIDKLSSHLVGTSAEVDDDVNQLENILKSWTDVRAEMQACTVLLEDTQQLLTAALPHHQQDLQLESDKLEVFTPASLNCVCYDSSCKFCQRYIINFDLCNFYR